MKRSTYRPTEYYQGIPELRRALDMIRDGTYSPERRDPFQPITEAILRNGDPFFILADFASYVACHQAVQTAYRDEANWIRRSILNAARMGRFSSDNTVRAYARDIWRIPNNIESGASALMTAT